MPVATEALGDPGLRAIFNFDNATTRNLRIEQTRIHAVLPQDRDARTHTKRQGPTLRTDRT
jgi:hypothetical protein